MNTSVYLDFKPNVLLYGQALKEGLGTMVVPQYQTSTLELTVAGNTIIITNYPTYLVAKLIEDFVNASVKKAM